MIGEFKAGGCELVAVADNLHLKPGDDDAVSDVFLFALGLAGKFERIAINDRISAARDRLEAEGRSWGRHSSLTAADRLKLVELKQAGRTVRQIGELVLTVHLPASA